MRSPVLVHETLSLSAGRTPDKEALICGDERWTYRLLDSTSTRMSQEFAEVGLECRDRAAILLDNCSEAVLAIYSILKAGGVFTVLNHSVKARKLAFVLRDSGARILITHTNKATIVTEALSGLPSNLRAVVWVGGESAIPVIPGVRSLSWQRLLNGREAATNAARETPFPAKAPPPERTCCDSDLAAIVYTSGSTGEPKGVMATHANMISAARCIIQYLENTPEDIILNVLPLSFTYGLYQIIMTFLFGGTIVLEKSFMFPVKAMDRMARENVTGFPIVPTVAALILGMKNPGRLDFPCLRYMTNAAAAIPVPHVRRLRALFPSVKIYSMYGLTECNRVSYLAPDELDQRPSSVGKPVSGCRVSIVDEGGREVGAGEVGELAVWGANVMHGYWNAPELTARTFRRDVIPGETVLFSGDLFRRDAEGFLYFVARRDEQIKTKGERVSPKEVENVICTLEGVAEATVVGIPDEILGEAVKCFIVCRPGMPLKKREVLKHCSENLEAFMLPKFIELLDEMPRTPHGKIDKSYLKTL